MNVRKWLIGLNLAATLALLGALFIFVNFIASRRYVRLDLTKTKITALSDKTRQVLKQLQQPVKIIVFYQPGQHLYELIRDVLKEYEAASPKLSIDYVDPEQDRARALQLAKQFEIDRENLVVFEAGTRHKYLSDTDLAEYDYATAGLGTQPAVKSFKAEEAFTSAIVSVTQATQPLVWVTKGHGEKAIDDVEPAGLAELKKRLEQENMRVEAVTLLERSDIPPDVSAILIAGPTRRFTEQELLLVQSYLERGGRLLALVDPLTDSGLDGLFSRWGIELGQNIVVDPARQLPFVSAANLFVTTYTQHPIVEKMQTLMTLFPLARSVQPAHDLKGVTVTKLALTSESGWGETETNTKPFKFNEGTDLKGPVSIAVAAERPAATPTRLVVIGDSDFVGNAQLPNVGNADFALGTFHWLAAQEQLIGIGPKPFESIKLNLTAAQMSGVFWFNLAGLPSLSIFLGLGVWWLRRT
ncbi:MAG: GldG family protein [Candidatus Omnitrophica bacterium]|nr:GldG family protein [Candidatus Omnitrophota bacterium]